MSSVNTKSQFEVKPHSDHPRLLNIEMNKEALKQFFEETKDIGVERIEYVPFMRFYLAEQLREVLGEEFQNKVQEIMHDRNTGGFTIGVQKQTAEIDNYIKFSTALSHLIGVPNFDGMSGKYYARFDVKHTFDSDTYLRQAYRRFNLHTDGTFVNEKTDWVLMMKFQEENAEGGESILLHIDDWDDLDKFRNHPLANLKYEFSQKGRASKNIDQEVYDTTFFESNNKTCIRFNDQCSVPKTIEQARYHKQISDSLEATSKAVAIELPIGDMVIVNNNFWLHGRGSFEKNPKLYRELLRQRGYFAEV
ncbi:carbon starvation induced protein CsiD [Peribacillus cavernae]|uniref:Carbon starvation induced protein CsiD n=1 Tax=Peribacillus cavernae TaxID=1674310 RepID=A0A3S0VU58_9BACI|nr:glutarate dioxygenase GlaH [Peribacillus cavernae]MDQ0221135.1 protein CsiD [Peribacillus cavernae]RUQ32825.1 carbon starvation induced protein CsiD [Peribacillus cavernae]